MKRKILLIIISTLFLFNLSAQIPIPQLTDSARVSLLTSTPSGEAVYTLFGHTAVRIIDDSLNIDLVFNYGLFDFESDSFILRFIKGETDYMVGGTTYEHYIFGYRYRGVGVEEQFLNISLSEKQAIFTALAVNASPENRVYRYNFFYDNCATRPRDIISDNIDGKINYTPYTPEQTYRDLVEERMIINPWTRFGINLVIAGGADVPITERQKDFLPLYLHSAFANANIENKDGSYRELISESKTVLEPVEGALELQQITEKHPDGYSFSFTDQPFLVGCFLFLLGILVSYLSYYKKNGTPAKIFDTLLFLVAGLTGCIIFFLMFFSEHPCVDNNWNLVWLNPLPLLVIPFFFAKSFSKYVISYHFVNFVALTLFLIGMSFVTQKIDTAFIPYMLALWLRSGVNLLQFRKDK